MDQPTTYKRLLRSKTNRVYGGVCGGLGDYFGVDPTIIRILTVVLAFASGGGVVLVYFILWWVIPEAGQENQSVADRANNAQAEIKQVVTGSNGYDRRAWVGVILIGVGVIALANTLLPWRIFRWDFFWPVIIIMLGLLIVFRRR